MMNVPLLDCNLMTLIITSSVNDTVKINNGKIEDGKFELGLSQFMSKINGLLSKYVTNFAPTRLAKTKLEESDVKALIEDKFKGLIKLDGNQVVIQILPDTYEQNLKAITIPAARKYSQFLIKQVRDISKIDQATKEISRRHTDANVDDKQELNKNEKEDESDEHEDLKEEDENSDSHEKDDSEAAEGSVHGRGAQMDDVPSSQNADLRDSERDDEELMEEDEADETQDTLSEDKGAGTPGYLKRAHSPSVNSSQHKRFQNIAVNLINSIQEHRFSSPFLQAVNKKEASDYYDLIYEPKDLKNILKSIKSKNDPPEYNSIKQLERDIMLMFANCVMYNQSNESLVELTISMRDDVSKMFELFEEAEQDIK